MVLNLKLSAWRNPHEGHWGSSLFVISIRAIQHDCCPTGRGLELFGLRWRLVERENEMERERERQNPRKWEWGFQWKLPNLSVCPLALFYWIYCNSSINSRFLVNEPRSTWVSPDCVEQSIVIKWFQAQDLWGDLLLSRHCRGGAVHTSWGVKVYINAHLCSFAICVCEFCQWSLVLH